MVLVFNYDNNVMCYKVDFYLVNKVIYSIFSFDANKYWIMTKIFIITKYINIRAGYVQFSVFLWEI